MGQAQKSISVGRAALVLLISGCAARSETRTVQKFLTTVLETLLSDSAESRLTLPSRAHMNTMRMPEFDAVSEPGRVLMKSAGIEDGRIGDVIIRTKDGVLADRTTGSEVAIAVGQGSAK